MLNKTESNFHSVPFLSTLYFIFLIILLRPTLDLWVNKSLFPGNSYAMLNIAAAISLLIFFAYLLFLLKKSLSHSIGKIKRPPLSYPLQSFILYSITVSLLVSSNKLLVIADFFRLVTILLFYLLCYRFVDTEKKAKKFTQVFLYSSIIPISVGFIQFLYGSNIFLNIFNRISGTFVNPVQFGHFLSLISIFAIVFWLNNKKKNSIYFFFAGLAILCLLLTYTRGAWLGFFAGIGSLVILTKSIGRKLFLILIISSVSLLVLLFLPNINELLISSINFTNTEISSVATRLLIWHKGFGLFLENPLFGIGLKQSFYILNVEPHNDYLRVLIELGIIGLIQFLLISYFMIRKSYKIIR